jgi:hypothetical protein
MNVTDLLSCAYIWDKRDKYISGDELCMTNFFVLLPSICVKATNWSRYSYTFTQILVL